MADPLSVLGGVAAIVSIITNVTKLAKNLNEVRESYNNLSLNITLVASKLSTIRAALEALHTWRAGDKTGTEASVQLDQDLGLSLSCCAILITVIDGKLAESGFREGMGKAHKVRYLWLEDTLKEYVSNLEGQVAALQLLLTIFQCRTATEQKQQLAKAESRTIIEQVRAETMTLGAGETEMDDAMSILSHDPSVHLDVESILMKSPAYVRVYGEVRAPNGIQSMFPANPPLLQRDPPRRKKASGPPPPPPPRRKVAPKVSLPSLEAKARSISTLQNVKPLPRPPSEILFQSSPPPAEIAPQPPPVPARPKPRNQPRQSQPQSPSQKQSPSQARINVWDFLGPGQEEKLPDAAATVMVDSAQVFELPALGPQVQADAVPLPSTSAQAEPNLPGAEGPHIPDPRAESPSRTDPTSSLREFDMPGREDAPSERLSSLERFRIELKRAFEESRPPTTGGKELRLPIGPISPFEKSTPIRDEEVATIQEQQETRGEAEAEAEAGSQEEVKSTKNGISDGANGLIEANPKTLSIHSGVDLYDASVRNMPIEQTSRPPSTSHLRNDAAETVSIALTNDRLEAETEGLSVFNQQLAAKYHENQIVKYSESQNVAESSSAIPKETEETLVASDIAATPVKTQDDQPRSVATSHLAPSKLDSSPEVVMRPSIDGPVIDPFCSNTIHNDMPASPARPLPLPPNRAPPMIPIQISSPPVLDQTSRNSTGADTLATSSGRDSSVFDASSTISSSERSFENAISTLPQSVSNTTATSISIDSQGVARQQAQADLRRLQSELTAAKRRGDSHAAQASLQKSIEVIQRTYLAASTPIETKKSPSLRDRASFMRFPSLSGSSQSSALGDAAAGGDLTKVRALIDAKVNVDARGKAFKTPLMLAAMNGHIHCLDFFKQYGADEFAVDAKGRSVIHLAVACNRLPVLRWLLSAYPPPRPQQLRHRVSILSKATDSLITRYPKNLREASDAEGSKPLHVAVEVDKGDTMKTLLAAGVDIEAKNNWARTPLHEAIISNHRNSFNILLEIGASVNATDARSMSPLHWAAKTGHIDMIEPLLARGADRHGYNSDGLQPIHQAAWVGQVLGIESLAAERKSLEARTKAGESMLHIACLNKNSELATHLLKNTVEVNSWAAPQPTLLETLSKFKVPLTSLTPLHYACCKADYEMALLLLDHEAWVNAATPEGVTALMMAAESEDTNLINLLLNRGAKANANMPGTLGTALHIASRRGDLETVQQLCRAGGNFRARSHGGGGSYGRTPAEEATAKCTDKVKKNAVEEYFQTIRQNTLRNAQVRAVGERARASSIAPSMGFRPSLDIRPSLNIRPSYPVSYAPWGQQNVVPIQEAQGGYQQPWPATYPSFIPQPQVQMPQQWYDPNPLTHVESPPPYQAGSSVPTRLATQAPVYRPGDTTGPNNS